MMKKKMREEEEAEEKEKEADDETMCSKSGQKGVDWQTVEKGREERLLPPMLFEICEPYLDPARVTASFVP
jgi:hypothetical protein